MKTVAPGKWLSFLFLFLDTFAFPVPSQELIINGGFESGNLQGWKAYNPGNHTLDWGLTSDPAAIRSGNYAGYLKSFGGSGSLLILYNSTFVSQLPKPSLVRARIWVKTEGLEFTQTSTSTFPPELGARVIFLSRARNSTVLSYAYANGRFAGTWDYIPVEIWLELPANAWSVEIQISLDTGITDGALFFDDASLEAITDLPSTIQEIPLGVVEKDAAGIPRLMIDGKVRAPLCFFGNVYSSVIYDEIALAQTAGVNLVSIPIDLPWIGTGTGMLAQVLTKNPNAMMILRIPIYPPSYWLNAHPLDLILNQDRQPIASSPWPSLADEDLLEAWEHQFERLIQILHNTPYRDHIIGYHPCYLQTGEWFYPDLASHYFDYSKPNRSRFAAWSSEKYAGDLDALNSSWATNETDFNSIQIPPYNVWEQGDDGVFRDPSVRRKLTDYFTYFNEKTVDTMQRIASWIKQLTYNRSLVFYFYGYQNELVSNGFHRGIAHCGHLALRKLLESPNVDILCSPISYYDRGVGQPSNLTAVVDTVTAAGKLYLQEDDSNTWLVDLANRPDTWNPRYPTEATTLSCLRRNFGNVLAHNMGIWWMDLWADGRYNSSSIWENNRLMNETYVKSISSESTFPPQVAVIYDEDSPFWLKSDSYSLTSKNSYSFRSVFQKLGTPAGYYHIQDLPSLSDSIRLLVFVNTFRISNEEEILIEQAKRGGRVFLWLYAPGYVTEESLSIPRMETLTGFSLSKGSTAIYPQVNITNSSHPITEDLAGHYYGTSDPISPVFHGKEPQSNISILGRYNRDGKPALMIREMDDWTSIFSGAPWVSTALLRSIARYAAADLLVDADDLNREDAVQFNGQYLYVYAMGLPSRRSFTLPGERIPNGSFERFEGNFPTRGFNRWISPSEGNTGPCHVVSGPSPHGERHCETGPIQNQRGEIKTLLEIRFMAKSGTTYRFSCWAMIHGLNASSARAGDSLLVHIGSETSDSPETAFMIADGTRILIPQQKWICYSAMVHNQPGTGKSAAMKVELKLSGGYEAANISLDKVSVLEESATKVSVSEIVEGQDLGRGITGWTFDFEQNDQRIFEIKEDNPESSVYLHVW